MIPLPLHLFIHFALAILTGYLAGNYFKKIKWGIIAGFFGGFLIDLDHILEYFLVFGLHFNLINFLQGRQFLATDELHLWFHAWEYVPVLLLLGWIYKKKLILKTIFITLAIAMSVHLLTDSVINNVSPKFYSLSYRASQNFSAQRLMTPVAYQENVKLRLKLGM